VSSSDALRQTSRYGPASATTPAPGATYRIITCWNVSQDEAWGVINSLETIATSLSRFTNYDPITTFRMVFGHIDFQLSNLHTQDGHTNYGLTTDAHHVQILPNVVIENLDNVIDPGTFPLARLVTHEMGHVFSLRLEEAYKNMQRVLPGNFYPKDWPSHPEQLLKNQGIYTADQEFVTGACNGIYNRNGNPIFQSPVDYPYKDVSYYHWGHMDDQYGSRNVKILTGYQWHPRDMEPNGNTAVEDFGDIFQNWFFFIRRQ
jgi:hypothetical protein